MSADIARLRLSTPCNLAENYVFQTLLKTTQTQQHAPQHSERQDRQDPFGSTISAKRLVGTCVDRGSFETAGPWPICSDLPVQPTKFIPRQPLWLLNGNIIKSIYHYLREFPLVLTCIGST